MKLCLKQGRREGRSPINASQRAQFGRQEKRSLCDSKQRLEVQGAQKVHGYVIGTETASAVSVCKGASEGETRR